MADLGYEVNYTAADEFDGSDTTCCFPEDEGSSSIEADTSKPPLSEEGLAYATEFGLNYLKGRKLPSETIGGIQEEDTNIMYVGDRLVTVYVYENGHVYDVGVTSE